MVGYFETGKLLTRFLCDNYLFWLREGKTEGQAISLAVRDADGIIYNPFDPDGELLDAEAAKIAIGAWEEFMRNFYERS